MAKWLSRPKKIAYSLIGALPPVASRSLRLFEVCYSSAFSVLHLILGGGEDDFSRLFNTPKFQTTLQLPSSGSGKSAIRQTTHQQCAARILPRAWIYPSRIECSLCFIRRQSRRFQRSSTSIRYLRGSITCVHCVILFPILGCYTLIPPIPQVQPANC